MTEHFIHVCKHDRIVTQCRCPGPKTRRVVPCGPACSRPPSKEKLARFGARVVEILESERYPLPTKILNIREAAKILEVMR